MSSDEAVRYVESRAATTSMLEPHQRSKKRNTETDYHAALMFRNATSLVGSHLPPQSHVVSDEWLLFLSTIMPTTVPFPSPVLQPGLAMTKVTPNLVSTGSDVTSALSKLKKHKHYYMSQGNIVIQVSKTLFKLDLNVLHVHSPVLRMIVPPIHDGKMPLIGFNDTRPLVLREIPVVDFVGLLSVLFPLDVETLHKPRTVDELVGILRLARNFQMDDVGKNLTSLLHELPIEPIRKIAIWEEFHLDPDLLLSSYATLCQRSEPLTMAMTLNLGLRTFTKVAASRDIYRQRVGCCGCRKSLSLQESQAIAEEIVAVVFAKPSLVVQKSTILAYDTH